MSDADQDLELVVEDQEEFRARRNLQILYDAVEEAHTQIRRAQSGETSTAEVGAYVGRLIAMVRPAMKDTEHWNSTVVGRMRLEDSAPGHPNTVKFEGLADVYQSRTGFVYTAEIPKEGYGPHTKIVRMREYPSLDIWDDALGIILEWMQDVDLGMPLEEMGGDTLEL